MTDREEPGESQEQLAEPHAARREARRLALAAVFEADFGHRTARAALERQLAGAAFGEETCAHARALVEATARERDTIDARIEELAPAYPVVQLAPIDRALLRSALGELLHSPTTPARVAISEWVELARTFSGESARRLLNGVLGSAAQQADPGDGHGKHRTPSRRAHDGGSQPRPQEGVS